MTQPDPELDEEPHLKPSQCTLLGPVNEAEAELGERFHRNTFNIIDQQTIMEAKFKIEKTCFTLLALDPVCQVTDGNRHTFRNLGHFQIKGSVLTKVSGRYGQFL